MYPYVKQYHVRRDIRVTEYIEYIKHTGYTKLHYNFWFINDVSYDRIDELCFMTNAELSHWPSLVPYKIKFHKKTRSIIELSCNYAGFIRCVTSLRFSTKREKSKNFIPRMNKMKHYRYVKCI